MSLSLYFSNQSPVKIWGLTSAERIQRVLPGRVVKSSAEDFSTLPENDFILVLRGDYLLDDRLVKHLAATPNILLCIPDGQRKIAVAAHVPARLAGQARAVLEAQTPSDSLPGVRIETPTSISVAFQETLLKFEPPFVLPITEGKKQDLERRLFDWSYKGITDLVTKWAWPRPARWAVKHCVRWQIKPNHVTLVGFLLVILTGVLFSYGQYGWGLLTGWLMTFLDTVDGKLARVTVTSSKFGHYFDHIIDLVHPPIWYILWGLGLTTTQLAGLGFSLSTFFYLIVVGYVAGRLVEGTFQWFLSGRFGIFCWQPIDSYFRLITARRNPNMIFLTMSFFMGRPELGLLAITFWTVATSVFLLIRLLLAGHERSSQGHIRSWLADADQPKYAKTLAFRWFTKHTTQ